jgi:hypothetical protein
MINISLGLNNYKLSNEKMKNGATGARTVSESKKAPEMPCIFSSQGTGFISGITKNVIPLPTF